MSRRMDALRRLAERPGTEHEGAVALAMLERERDKVKEIKPEDCLSAFLRGDIHVTDFVDMMQRHRGTPEQRYSVEQVDELPTCPCGQRYYHGHKCLALDRHEAIRVDIRNRFPLGSRVYCNRWAYSTNCPGTVVAHVKDPELWGWISIRFDHLKSARRVPVISNKGCHLSTRPLKPSEADRMAGI